MDNMNKVSREGQMVTTEKVEVDSLLQGWL